LTPNPKQKHEVSIKHVGFMTRGPRRPIYEASCSCGHTYGQATRWVHHELRHDAHLESLSQPEHAIMDTDGVLTEQPEHERHREPPEHGHA